MPTYRYLAVDYAGATRAGELDAATRALALELLDRDGLVPLSLDDAAGRESGMLGWNLSFVRRRKRRNEVDLNTLTSLTHSIAALLKAGLTIDRALSITHSLESRSGAKAFLGDVAKSVRAGKSLTDAIAATQIRLPGYYLSMIQAGEAGGMLAATLSRAGELLRRQNEVRQRVINALTYPTLLLGVVLLTMIILVAFVLPRFQSLFAESEATLPWSTQLVLTLGGLASRYWWLMCLGLASALAGTVAYFRRPVGRVRMDRWMLKTRWSFGIPVALDTGRLLRTLSVLIGNGVPLPSALRIARGTLTNHVLQEALLVATQQVKAGQNFTVALAATGEFPSQAIQLLRVGEETGRLPELMLEAAELLETEGQVRLERLMALLVPLLTVLMGFIVAGLIGSVFVGLLSINDLAY